MGKSTISMAIFNCYVSSPEGKTCHFSIQIPQELGLQTNPYSAPAMAAGRNPICTAMGIKMAPRKKPEEMRLEVFLLQKDAEK